MNEIFITIILLFVAGIFICIETAVISLSRREIDRLVETQRKGAKNLLWLRIKAQNFRDSISVIVLFTILASAAASGLFLAKSVQIWVQKFPYAFLQSVSYPISMIIAVIILLLLVQLFVYKIPRSIGSRYSKTIALFSSSLSRLVTIIVSPLIDFFNRLLVILFSRRTKKHLEGLRRAELLYDLDLTKDDAIISKNEFEIIKNVLEFSETTAKEIMVPRPDIVAFAIDTPREEIIKVVTEEGFSRIPVYEGTIDNIIGIVFAKDLISMFAHKNTIILEDILRSVHFVPETKKISEILLEFQQQKSHLAIVIDEFGGTEGIITLEDIIEEIIGEIHDEYDEIKLSYIKNTDGTWMIDGGMNISEFNETFGVQIPEDFDYDTVNGFLHKITGRIPEVNEEIQFGNLSFTIVRKSDRRIEKIRVKRYKPIS